MRCSLAVGFSWSEKKSDSSPEKLLRLKKKRNVFKKRSGDRMLFLQGVERGALSFRYCEHA